MSAKWAAVALAGSLAFASATASPNLTPEMESSELSGADTPRSEIPASLALTETDPTLAWEENFDSFRPALWKKEHSTFGDGNSEQQCYRPENVSVVDGNLVLRAVRERYTCPQGSTRAYTSGMVRSQGVTFSPGQRIEFRVKVTAASPDDQRGLWPALWASSWNGGAWPQGGELDWLEYVGTTPYTSNHAIHYRDLSGAHEHIAQAVPLASRFSESWHTITFDWGTDLVWYLDGQQVQRINAASIPAIDNPFTQAAAPITELKINLALGGTWPGPVGDDAVDSQGTTTFMVDYVRIYDLPER